MRLDYAGPERGRPWKLNIPLAVLVALALSVRLAWVLHLPADPSSLDALPDQREYLELGRNLLSGEGLQFVDPRFADTVYAYRTPGYPLFIAACGGSIRMVRIMQAGIDAAGVLAVYLLSVRWLTHRAGLAAAAFVALNPFLVYFSGLILSETLFTAMLIWGMMLLVHHRAASLTRQPRGGGIAWWAGMVLLAFSILIRPSAIALPLALAIVSAFVNRHWRQPYDWRWSPPVGTLALLLTLVALLPWAWRNGRVSGRWVWTTTNSGITLYDGLNPDATGASDQRFIRAMPQLKLMDEIERSRYLGDLAWQFAREHPVRVAQLSVMKLARMWSPVPLSGQFGGDRKLVAVALLYMVPLYVLIVLGVWRAPLPRAVKVYLLTPALYFSLAHAITVGSLRYRIPADVPMAVLAGAGAGIAWYGRGQRSGVGGQETGHDAVLPDP